MELFNNHIAGDSTGFTLFGDLLSGGGISSKAAIKTADPAKSRNPLATITNRGPSEHVAHTKASKTFQRRGSNTSAPGNREPTVCKPVTTGSTQQPSNLAAGQMLPPAAQKQASTAQMGAGSSASRKPLQLQLPLGVKSGSSMLAATTLASNPAGAASNIPLQDRQQRHRQQQQLKQLQQQQPGDTEEDTAVQAVTGRQKQQSGQQSFKLTLDLFSAAKTFSRSASDMQHSGLLTSVSLPMHSHSSSSPTAPADISPVSIAAKPALTGGYITKQQAHNQQWKLSLGPLPAQQQHQEGSSKHTAAADSHGMLSTPGGPELLMPLDSDNDAAHQQPQQLSETATMSAAVTRQAAAKSAAAKATQAGNVAALTWDFDIQSPPSTGAVSAGGEQTQRARLPATGQWQTAQAEMQQEQGKLSMISNKRQRVQAVAQGACAGGDSQPSTYTSTGTNSSNSSSEPIASSGSLWSGYSSGGDDSGCCSTIDANQSEHEADSESEPCKSGRSSRKSGGVKQIKGSASAGENNNSLVLMAPAAAAAGAAGTVAIGLDCSLSAKLKAKKVAFALPGHNNDQQAAVVQPAATGRKRTAAAVAAAEAYAALPGQVPLLLPGGTSLSRGDILLVELPACFEAAGDSGAIGRLICSRDPITVAATIGAVSSQGSAEARRNKSIKTAAAAGHDTDKEGILSSAGQGSDSVPAYEGTDAGDCSESLVHSANIGNGCGSEGDKGSQGTEAGGQRASAGAAGAVTGFCLDLKGIVYSTMTVHLAGTAAVVRVNMAGSSQSKASAVIDRLFNSSFVRAAPDTTAAGATDDPCFEGFAAGDEFADDLECDMAAGQTAAYAAALVNAEADGVRGKGRPSRRGGRGRGGASAANKIVPKPHVKSKKVGSKKGQGKGQGTKRGGRGGNPLAAAVKRGQTAAGGNADKEAQQ